MLSKLRKRLFSRPHLSGTSPSPSRCTTEMTLPEHTHRDLSYFDVSFTTSTRSSSSIYARVRDDSDINASFKSLQDDNDFLDFCIPSPDQLEGGVKQRCSRRIRRNSIGACLSRKVACFDGNQLKEVRKRSSERTIIPARESSTSEELPSQPKYIPMDKGLNGRQQQEDDRRDLMFAQQQFRFRHRLTLGSRGRSSVRLSHLPRQISTHTYMSIRSDEIPAMQTLNARSMLTCNPSNDPFVIDPYAMYAEVSYKIHTQLAPNREQLLRRSHLMQLRSRDAQLMEDYSTSSEDSSNFLSQDPSFMNTSSMDPSSLNPYEMPIPRQCAQVVRTPRPTVPAFHSKVCRRRCVVELLRSKEFLNVLTESRQTLNSSDGSGEPSDNQQDSTCTSERDNDSFQSDARDCRRVDMMPREYFTRSIAQSNASGKQLMTSLDTTMMSSEIPSEILVTSSVAFDMPSLTSSAMSVEYANAAMSKLTRSSSSYEYIDNGSDFTTSSSMLNDNGSDVSTVCGIAGKDDGVNQQYLAILRVAQTERGFVERMRELQMYRLTVNQFLTAQQRTAIFQNIDKLISISEYCLTRLDNLVQSMFKRKLMKYLNPAHSGNESLVGVVTIYGSSSDWLSEAHVMYSRGLNSALDLCDDLYNSQILPLQEVDYDRLIYLLLCPSYHIENLLKALHGLSTLTSQCTGRLIDVIISSLRNVMTSCTQLTSYADISAENSNYAFYANEINNNFTGWIEADQSRCRSLNAAVHSSLMDVIDSSNTGSASETTIQSIEERDESRTPTATGYIPPAVVEGSTVSSPGEKKDEEKLEESGEISVLQRHCGDGATDVTLSRDMRDRRVEKMKRFSTLIASSTVDKHLTHVEDF